MLLRREFPPSFSKEEDGPNEIFIIHFFAFLQQSNCTKKLMKKRIFFAEQNTERLNSHLTFISNYKSKTRVRYNKCYGDLLIHRLHLFPGTSQKRAITGTSPQSQAHSPRQTTSWMIIWKEYKTQCMRLVWTCDRNTNNRKCKEIVVQIALYFSRVDMYEVVFIFFLLASPCPPLPPQKKNATPLAWKAGKKIGTAMCLSVDM